MDVMETLKNYSQEDQVNIMTTLKIVQDRGWSPMNTDPYQFHIILGGKLLSQEKVIQSLENDLENFKEQLVKTENEMGVLKNNCKYEKEMVEDLEEDLNRKDGELKHLEKCFQNRIEIINKQDIIIKERNDEISQFRLNNTNLENQIVEGLKLEKKVKIQNNIIKELKTNLEDKEIRKNDDISKEIKSLLKEIEELRIENKEKEALLKSFNDENKMLKEKFTILEVRNKELVCHENLQKPTENVSLDEELINHNITRPFKCERCDKFLCSMADLSYHMRNDHEDLDEKEALKTKLRDLEWTLCQQKLNLTTTLYNLKENELKESRTCRCRGWCGINHQKYGWKISPSEEILMKMKALSTKH